MKTSFHSLLRYMMAGWLFLFSTPFNAYANSISEQSRKNVSSAFSNFFREFSIHISGLIGLGIVLSILTFALLFNQLSMNAHNPAERAKILRNLLIAGLCVALLGSVEIWFTLIFLSSVKGG